MSGVIRLKQAVRLQVEETGGRGEKGGHGGLLTSLTFCLH